MLRAWLVMVHNLCINVHIWLVGGGGGGGGGGHVYFSHESCVYTMNHCVGMGCICVEVWAQCCAYMCAEW